MKIDRIDITHVRIPLHEPFRISSGAVAEKDALILKLYADGLLGFGEASPMAGSFYSSDTPASCLRDLKNPIVPAILGKPFESAAAFNEILSRIQGSPFAKAGIENAFWDLLAQQAGKPLAEMIGGRLRAIPSGLAVGIYDTLPELIRAIERHWPSGYRRLKIKIQPGWDVEPVKAVRKHFGDIPLFVDANAAYTGEDLRVFQALDEFALMMFEQPLAKNDFEGHARLQHAVKTPVCLDESIQTVGDVEKAARLGSCRIVNIKIQRVGGLLHATHINAACQQHGIPTWCGTMPELGLGQAFGLHLATLDNFAFPSDIEPSLRWYTDDLIAPFIEINAKGEIQIPRGPSTGYALAEEKLQKYAVSRESFKA